MAAEIKVGVGADIKPLEKGLNDASKEVKAFDASVDKLTNQSAKAFDQFSKKAVQSNKAVGVSFQGTSRILSDVAFGPGAIANNLEALGREFSDLSRIAKESGQSIGKTLVQSLAGGGGLNLALGGLTLGLSLASFGLGAWERAFGTADKKVKDTTDSTKEYINSLDALHKASLTGAQNAQDELAHLRVLFNAYKNANVPLKARKEAYAELQEKYPAYFGNLKFEESATGKTTEAYNKLTQAILATGRARAAEGLIAENAKKQLVNEQKIVDLERERIPLIKDAAALKSKLDKLDVGASEAGAIRAQNLANAQIEATNKVAQSIAETNKLKEANRKLDEENLRLIQQINLETAKGASLTGNVGGEATINKISELKKITGIAGGVATTGALVAPAIDFGPMKESLALGLGALNEFSLQINSIIQSGVINAFTSMGDAIGSALSEGASVISAVGASLLSSLGSILSQLGQMAIATGVGIEAIKKSLTTLSGVGAIAAGVALLSLGAFVKGKAKSLGGAMGTGGGGFSSPSSPGSGFQPASPVQFSNGQSSNIFIPSATIKGNDIVIAYNRTTALNGRMGS